MLSIEHCAEYDSAAEWCAKRGLKGTIGDPLPDNLSLEVAQSINDWPEDFEQRVRQCAYALAMTPELRDPMWPQSQLGAETTTKGGK